MRISAWILAGFYLSGVAPAAAAPPGLIEIHAQALTNDPELRAVQASSEAVRASRRQSIGALLPSLSATAESGRTRENVKTTSIGFPGETTFDTDIYAITLRQPLFRMDLFARLGQSKASVTQAEAEYGAAQQALIVKDRKSTRLN